MGSRDGAVGPDRGHLVVLTGDERGGRAAGTVVVGLDGVDAATGARFVDALAELLTPPRRRPRFVLEAAPLTLIRPGGPGALGPVRRLLGRLAARGAWGRGRSLHLPVPTALAASPAGMGMLVRAWRRYVGPCRAHLVRDADDAEALMAGRSGGVRRRVTVRRARRWVESPAGRTGRPGQAEA